MLTFKNKTGATFFKQSPFINKYSLAVLSMALIFIYISVTQVLGQYQNQNGDYGQYYMHARNLLKGRPWDYFVEGFPAVLPGYPIFLAFIQTIFGTMPYPVAIANSLMWAIIGLISYNIFSPRFTSKITALIFAAAVFSTPFVMYFQQDGQPNISYSLTFIAALWAIYNYSPSQSKRCQLMLIGLILLPAFFRVESTIIYIAFAIYLISNKNRALLWVPAFGFLLTIGLDVWISIRSEMVSNFIEFYNKTNLDATSEQSSTLARISEFFISYLESVFAHLSTTAHLFTFTPNNAHDFISITSTAGPNINITFLQFSILAMFFTGFMKIKAPHLNPSNPQAFLSLDRLFLMGHIAIISLFFLKVIPHRYLVPIAPIFLFYVFIGAERLIETVKPVKLRFIILNIVMIAFTYGLTQAAFHPDRKPPIARNYIYGKDFQALMVNLKNLEVKDSSLGYWKTRVLMIGLDQSNIESRRDAELRTPISVDAFFETENAVWIRFVPYRKDSLDDYVDQREDICVILDSHNHRLYAQINSKFNCLTD
jgi:hypothetical protein